MALAARSTMALRTPTSSAVRRSIVVRADAAAAPSAPPPRPMTGKEWMKTQPGVSAPFGFFDPAGLCDAPGFSIGEAKRFRESEVTHGRVAMLAVVGWIVAEGFHPLFGGQIDGPAFVHFQKVESIWPQFWEIILLAVGITEAYRIGVAYNAPGMDDQLKSTHVAGEIGFDPMGLYPKNPTEKFEIQTKEINNGRLAMLAIAGFAGQEEKDHETIFNALFHKGAAPL